MNLLRRHGLFDAKVPRYTSYPPANHFEEGVGTKRQKSWLRAVPGGDSVSVYVHIPFCRRLCWFCACRTQGTRTMRPVDAYVETLLQEIAQVRETLPPGIRMARLHLGGGTPTILSPATMRSLLSALFADFKRSPDFEFSAEIDPTDAPVAVLQALVDFGLTRASIGVQDFSPQVQEAIGRHQTFEETEVVTRFLRNKGITGVNFDLLYGLPFQTADSFGETLSRVADLRPERLAIYGYAHVPWMSKRQVMIPGDTLPGSEARFALARQAERHLAQEGYRALGIDHFALPSDSLYAAAQVGRLRRNFQGYTDDANDTLIGLGASSISRFRQGYVQNAIATSAYQARIQGGALAGHRGFRLRSEDKLKAAMIEDLMCRFRLHEPSLRRAFPRHAAAIGETARHLLAQFPDAFSVQSTGPVLREEARPLVRIIAHCVDDFATSGASHSFAV